MQLTAQESWKGDIDLNEICEIYYILISTNPVASDTTPRRCAKEGPNGVLQASSNSTPEVPSVCVRQRSGADGWERNLRGLGTKERRYTGAEGAECKPTKHKRFKARHMLCRTSILMSTVSLPFTLPPSLALTRLGLDSSPPDRQPLTPEPLRLPPRPSSL